MAVVQQLVRVTNDELERCRNNQDTLHQVISFELRPDEDYLNLDWSPSGLAVYFEKSEQLPEVQAALRLATEGARVVNPACTDPQRYFDIVNDYNVYSHITELTPDEVRSVANDFQLIDMEKFLDWLPQDIATARQILGKDAAAVPVDWHPNQYYHKYLKDLVNFYKTASFNNWATIMWWD